MSFTPPFLPRVGASEFPPGGVVQLRVMTDVALSPAQTAQLSQHFERHKMALRTSLAQYVAHNGELADGTPFRIVSNGPQHMVMVWPGGKLEPPLPLSEWFRAVPTSATNKLGAGSFPSRAWKVPDDPHGWPDELQPVSFIPDHPGHVTWSNTALKYGGKPIVVSWRGPRGRYAATTGFTDPAGGDPIAHEKDPLAFPAGTAIANNLFIDTKFVWINGHKIDTGLLKIVAACLHEYDPDEAPDKFVLRVAVDRRAGTPQRQLAVFDLVPQDGSAGAGLKNIAEAKAPLFVKATYVAEQNTPQANVGGSSSTPGEWDYWQRPHFNKSGSRLATIITMVGANGVDREMHAVSFDATTWELDDDIQARSTSIATLDTGGLGVGPNRPLSSDGTSTLERFAAVDFEDDTFVYVKYTLARHLIESGEFGGEAVGGTNIPESGESHLDDTWTGTLTHSLLGDLNTSGARTVRDYVLHYTGGSGHPFVVNATITYSLQGGFRDFAEGFSGPYAVPHFTFWGDLSRRTFAVGYWLEGTAAYTASGEAVNADNFTLTMSATVSRPQLVFDVWFDGVQVATATTGAFADAAPADASTTYPETTGQPAQVRSIGQAIPAGTTDTANTGSQTALYAAASFPQYPPQLEGPTAVAVGVIPGPSYAFGVPQVYQHCAVSPDTRAAYLGAAYFLETYGDTVTSGLELTIVQPGDGGPIVEDAPVYIAGPHPTMSAPVFMGPATEGAPK